MIDPQLGDIGKTVLYKNVPGRPERGVVTFWNDEYVFVRYGRELHSKATRREHLDWEHP